MRRNTLAAALSMLAVFASGTVVGTLGHRLYMVRSVAADPQHKETPEEWRRKYMAEITQKVKLDTTQVSQVNQILDETRAQYLAVKDKYKPEMEAIHQHQVERISALLSTPQKQAYDAFRAERDRARLEAEKKSQGK